MYMHYNTRNHIQTWISAPVVIPLVAMSLCSVRSDKPGILILAYRNLVTIALLDTLK